MLNIVYYLVNPMYINDLTLELEFLQQILTGIIDLICYIFIYVGIIVIDLNTNLTFFVKVMIGTFQQLTTCACSLVSVKQE